MSRESKSPLVDPTPVNANLRKIGVGTACGIALVLAGMTFLGQCAPRLNASELEGAPIVPPAEVLTTPEQVDVDTPAKEPGWFAGIKERFSRAGSALSGDPQAIVAEFNSQLIADRQELDERMAALREDESNLILMENKLLALKASVEETARQLLTASTNGQNTLADALKQYEAIPEGGVE